MNKDKSSTPQVELNRIIRENRVDDYPSTNLALGMRPLEFGPGTSGWLWEIPPENTINPFGTMQGGYLAVFDRRDPIDRDRLGAGRGRMGGYGGTQAELPARGAAATAEGRGRVIRRTRAIAFMDAEIRDADGELAVAASSTWAISRFKT